jgi:Pro-kumamolisin, activation domain/IPT/TIG domain/Subtilase family
MMAMRRARLAVLAITMAGGLAAGLMSPVPAAIAAGPGPQVMIHGDAAPVAPRGAIELGGMSAQSVLHLDVTLRVPDPAALASFIAAVSDRRSPLFGHFLARGQFAARFGPAPAQVAAVEAALRSEGLSPGPVSPDGLAIAVTAPAAAVERAFGTALLRYRLPGGRVAFSNSSAPRLPAAAAPYVQGVLGLSDLYRPHSQLVRAVRPVARGGHLPPRMNLTATTGPQPCAAASSTAQEYGSYTANQLASYYAMPPLYQAGDFGQGVHVALAEFEPDSPADISAYAACYGLHTAVSYTLVNGGAGSGSGSGEAALDIEDVMGLAPDVTIGVYQAPNGGDTDTYDLYSAIVNADADQVVSTSWGLCELDSDSPLIISEDDLFAQAATQGQTVFASAGDSGSTDCYGDGSSNGANLSVDDPASQPYVVGVGGTSIGSTSENVWNDSSVTEGAGGGGLSAAWCMPAYQDQTAIPGLISSYSQTAASCTTVPYVRQVPDVSADADPYTGYVIHLDGAWQGGWGGTSAATPLWAAVAALTDASPFCSDYSSGDAGVRPEGLYQVAATDHSYIYSSGEGLYDVTAGENDYTPSGYCGGLYPATSGYDLASGLGTPLVAGFDGSGRASMFYPGLAALMCRAYGTRLDTTAVTRVSPAQGPSAKTTTVTISGTGFLPVAGADMAYIGARPIPATCTSTTRCTVKLPAMRPGTVSIQISAEDFTLSSADAASHYRYVAAPTIKSLSPASGKPRGGNTITIRGTNFVGVTAVHFGGKRAARVRTVSATEILVTVPAGSGTVTVTVTATGGTSAGSRTSRYRYT